MMSESRVGIGFLHLVKLGIGALLPEVDTLRHVFQSLGLVSVLVSDHCVSTPGRDIAAMRAKLTGVENMS